MLGAALFFQSARADAWLLHVRDDEKGTESAHAGAGALLLRVRDEEKCMECELAWFQLQKLFTTHGTTQLLRRNVMCTLSCFHSVSLLLSPMGPLPWGKSTPL